MAKESRIEISPWQNGVLEMSAGGDANSGHWLILREADGGYPEIVGVSIKRVTGSLAPYGRSFKIRVATRR